MVGDFGALGGSRYEIANRYPLLRSVPEEYLRVAEFEGLSDWDVCCIKNIFKLPKVGALQKSDNGMYYISIEKIFIETVLATIQKRGFVLPPFFEDRSSSKAIGAHIRVIDAKELLKHSAGATAADKLVRKVNNFSLKSFNTLDVSDWPGVKTMAFFTFYSDDLRKVRETAGLSPNPSRGDFILTVGVIYVSAVPVLMSKRSEVEAETKAREADALTLKAKEEREEKWRRSLKTDTQDRGYSHVAGRRTTSASLRSVQDVSVEQTARQAVIEADQKKLQALQQQFSQRESITSSDVSQLSQLMEVVNSRDADRKLREMQEILFDFVQPDPKMLSYYRDYIVAAKVVDTLLQGEDLRRAREVKTQAERKPKTQAAKEVEQKAEAALDLKKKSRKSKKAKRVESSPVMNLSEFQRVAGQRGLTNEEVNRVLPLLDLPVKGRIYQNYVGTCFIELKYALTDEILKFIEKRGFSRQKGSTPYIEVISNEESTNGKYMGERGYLPLTPGFKIKEFRTKQVSIWSENVCEAYLVVESPELEAFRSECGLSPKLKGGDFTINVGVLREDVAKSLKTQHRIEKIQAKSITELDKSVQESDAKAAIAREREVKTQAAREVESKVGAAVESERSVLLEMGGYDRKEKIVSIQETGRTLLSSTYQLERLKVLFQNNYSLFNWSGVITQDKHAGSVYLKLSDSIVECLSPIFRNEGYKRPPFFDSFYGRPGWGAHATVIASNEVRSGKQLDIPEDPKVKIEREDITEVSIVHPDRWKAVSAAAVIVFNSSKLKEFRTKNGFQEYPNGHKFHITIATKPAKERW